MFKPSVQTIRVVDAKPAIFDFRPFTGSAISEPSQLNCHEQAWDEGFRAAKAEAEADRVALLALIASAEAIQPEPSEEVAALIAETVLRLVSNIVGTVEIDRDTLIRRAVCAAGQISDVDAARTMWVHPEDVGLLTECNLTLNIMPDPDAHRGSIRIDCSAGWIEHGTPLYLDALRSGLGLMEDAQ